MLQENPRILHISCHGLKLDLKRIQFDNERMEKENVLVFEKENGEGDLINSKLLNKMIWEKTPDLDVIFLAACDSEFAGRIFLKCQARHVICIQKDQKVLDEAAVMFTQRFYQFVFQGKSVCDAFYAAKSDVEAIYSEREARIFTMFVQEELTPKPKSDEQASRSMSHQCLPNVFKDVKVG